MSGAGEDASASERQSLLSHLLDAIKQCQIRFGGRTELATESDSRVVCLCAQFEAVLQHGIRKKGLFAFRQVTEIVRGLNLKNAESEPTFWNLVTTVLNRHEFERYMLLRNITTDAGRGRAWLRSALNEHSLERYMHMILADPGVIAQYYEEWAFLLDQERSSMLPMMAAGLGSILFAINIDNPDLNAPCVRRHSASLSSSSSSSGGGGILVGQNAKTESSDPQPVIAKATTSSSLGGKKKRKKKRPTSQFVSFDDDDVPNESVPEMASSYSSSRSAPPTCLSSPVGLSSPDAVAASHSRGPSPPPSGDDVMNKVEAPTCNGIPDGPSTTMLNCSSPSVSIHVSKFGQGSTHAEEDSSLSPPLKVDDDTLVNGNGPKHSGDDSNSLMSKFDNFRLSQRYLAGAVLTPLGDNSVGDLIPVSQIEDIPSSEDSVSIPSFGEDTENAAAALAFTQKVAAWATSDGQTQLGHKGGSLPATEPRSRADTMTMTADDLREALYTVMQRKEEVEEKNSSLRSLLDREMEINASLRAEIEALKVQHEDRVIKLEGTVQTLTRENDVLKHQLKKYIAAVQMLKRDSERAQENFSGLLGEIQPAIPEPKSFIDHQYEASEYEKKLVQVAEMHGELMEFNDRLHKLLLHREGTIRRLREELVDLRGPLPDDNQTSDDDVSITSDYDASSQTDPLSRPLINIWIPSAFLTGRGSDVHHVYQMYVRIRDEEWNIYRRYAQFYAFHKVLKKKHPIVNTFDFPPKKTIGSKDAKVVEERRKRIQHYMRCVVNWLLQSNVDLANNPDRDTLVSLLPFLGADSTSTLSTTSANANNNSSSNSPSMCGGDSLRPQQPGSLRSGGSRLRLPSPGGMSSSAAQERLTQQQQAYMGL